LGESWTVSREEVKLQPQFYSAGVDLSQHYTPVFYDGWTPNMTSIEFQSHNSHPTSNDLSRLAYATAAQAQQHQYYQQSQQKYGQVVGNVQSSAAAAAPQPPPAPPMPQKIHKNSIGDESTMSAGNRLQQSSVSRASRSGNVQNDSSTTLNYSNASRQLPPQTTINIRNYDEMKKWAVDLEYRGAKCFEVVYDRQANNEKELTVKAGELLEVLDDKRNWWKLRSFYGNIGHVPVTILRPFELSPSSSLSQFQQSAGNHSKVGQF
jgi:hypothetical protein